MPELPEVEAARLLVHEHCLGQVVHDMEVVVEDEIIFGMPKSGIKEAMRAVVGKQLHSTGRLGKYFWLSFDGNNEPGTDAQLHLLVHFGMTGFLQIEGIERSFYRSAPEKPGDKPTWPPRFTRLILKFPSNTNLAFGDSRRLGKILIVHGSVTEQQAIKGLGFDPVLTLKDHFQEFAKRCSARKVPVKALLLDQSFTAGVGNWMADDILYMAKLHPESVSSHLDSKSVERLFDACIRLSREAVDCKLSGREYPKEWLFHVRWDKKSSTTLDGKQVASVRVGGRSTIYVPSIQKKPTLARDE